MIFSLLLLPVVLAVGAARIEVGPDVLVSRDGDFPHCETWIAANPKDPKNLVGAATTLSKPPDGSFMNRTYASHDGGWTWTAATLPIEVENGGGDPQVGYLPDGTALFVGIGKFGMAVHRSEDGGTTWSKPAVLKFADHEMLAVDHTMGRFAGRVYLAGESGEHAGSKERVSRVVLYRSDDGGRSFIGPMTVAESRGTGLAVYPLAILSDGTLVVPMLRYPNPGQDKTTPVHSVECAVSTDGGVTFSAPRKIGDFYFGGYREFTKRKHMGRIDQMSGILFASSPNGPFRDRLYAVWTDFRAQNIPRLVLTVSKDAGRTWSPPRPIEPNGRAGSSQYQPMLAANGNGAVGVVWYDTRDFPERDRYDVYFAASIDGGESFLPSVKVSSQPSMPKGPGNVRSVPLANWDAADRTKPLAMDFYSAFSTWPDGGDYSGLAVDSENAFHPLWADSRSGTFQLYTSRIAVEREAVKPDEKPVSAARAPARVNDRVVLAYDPVAFDPATNELSIPVRLRNDSKQPVYPPIRVEVKETVMPALVENNSEEFATHPSILNASNGKSGEGAVFDYSHALGTSGVLRPGEMTDALVWRVRVEDAAKTSIHFGAEITALVDKEGTSK